MELALKLPGRGNRLDPVAGMPSGGENTLGQVILYGLTMLFIIVITTALIYFLWGGIAWITSQGDKTKIEAARKRIVYALVGFFIALISYLIINTIGNFFGIKLLNV